VKAEAEWARVLVNGLLQAAGIQQEAIDRRFRNLVPAARGLLDVMAEEIQRYHREQGGKKKP
jgi:hypothetical protein